MSYLCKHIFTYVQINSATTVIKMVKLERDNDNVIYNSYIDMIHNLNRPEIKWDTINNYK